VKRLSPRLHAPLDFGLAASFALAPWLLDFGGVAASLAHVIAAGVFVGSLATDYPLGIVKLVPFPIHGYAELASAFCFVAMPYLFGFGGVAASRNFFIFMGVGTIFVFILTDYRAGKRRREPPPR
jgi:hypothetical protein